MTGFGTFELAIAALGVLIALLPFLLVLYVLVLLARMSRSLQNVDRSLRRLVRYWEEPPPAADSWPQDAEWERPAER